jgi:hypothetical protein
LEKAFALSSSQETGQRALRTAFAKKGPSIQRDKKFDLSKPAQVGGHRLRDFGVDSEISEVLEQHRIPRGNSKFSTGLIYRAFLCGPA